MISLGLRLRPSRFAPNTSYFSLLRSPFKPPGQAFIAAIKALVALTVQSAPVIFKETFFWKAFLMNFVAHW